MNKNIDNPVGPMQTPVEAEPDSNNDINSKTGSERSECSVAVTQKWPPMQFTLGYFII